MIGVLYSAPLTISVAMTMSKVAEDWQKLSHVSAAASMCRGTWHSWGASGYRSDSECPFSETCSPSVTPFTDTHMGLQASCRCRKV